MDLRKDLERVRMLIDDVKKREREKLRISHLQKQYAETIYFPIIPIVEPILEKMESLEQRILARLGVPDPYSVPDAKA